MVDETYVPPTPSAEYKNATAVVALVGNMRADYEKRLATMENHITMLYAEVKQLQDLFAVQTVIRGSGSTVVE
jgi:hypothetical protein